jgi:hypothetical protein
VRREGRVRVVRLADRPWGVLVGGFRELCDGWVGGYCVVARRSGKSLGEELGLL